MSTTIYVFEQKYEKYQCFVSENFQFLEVKFSIYLKRHVFLMPAHHHYLSLRCPSEDALAPCLPTECLAKTVQTVRMHRLI